MYIETRASSVRLYALLNATQISLKDIFLYSVHKYQQYKEVQ